MSEMEEEESNIVKILISIIMLYGESGLPLNKVEKEYMKYCGRNIPYEKFGADNLRSWIYTLPNIYLIQNEKKEEVLIQQSQKSDHIKYLISKQKNNYNHSYSRRRYDNSNSSQNYYVRQKASMEMPNGCFIHNSINNIYINNYERHETYRKLESILPIFYRHQALGDDFFVDIADTKLGHYVPDNGPKQCGLCVAGQTIAELTERVKKADYLAPSVVVNIGFNDLLQDRNVNNMIEDMKQLVTELKNRNTRVTLITLIPSPKLPRYKKIKKRMETFNDAILDYAYSVDMKCSIIDMNKIFHNEQQKFQRDTDRFMKVAKNDSYKVFSDYGRKVFLSTLKTCLKKLVEYGH